MPSLRLALPLLFVLMPFSTPGPAQAGEFDALKEGATHAGFVAEAVYENEDGMAMGARFRHGSSGYVLDLLRIQSIPQGFMWVNSMPPSDQGEPHTLEHLLLGKGTKGRYLASLEDMSLGRSSAFTQRRRTCYHFSTEAGRDVFFQLFEAKLDAMINPNFTDEEIRREVCNMGLVDRSDGSLWLEEKGTVYNEMVSSYERPWGNLYRKLTQLLYGESHPLALESGGLPAAIREMTPENLRAFHSATHHLGEMGVVLSIGDEIGLNDCLERVAAILDRVEPGAPAGDPADLWERIPDPRPAKMNTVALTHFPHQNEDEPGLAVLAWPPARDLDAADLYLYELFMSLLASGQTSNLYRMFIDSQSRVLDIGANSVFTWVDDQPGFATFVGMNAVDPASCTEASLTKIRELVLDEIRKISRWEDDDPALTEFNRRAQSRVLQDRRSLREFLNSPPRFGYRGTGSAWLDHLQELHRKGGFRRNLAAVDELAAAEALLAGGANFWRDRVSAWKLLDAPPFAAATTADPGLIASDEEAREERIEAFIDGLREEFDAATGAEAIAEYKKRYEQATEVIDQAAAGIAMPGFVDRPPLSLDPQLKFDVESLPGGGDWVVSTFENITSGTAGLAFDLYAVPENELYLVPAMPTLLRNAGVVRDGMPMSYDEVDNVLRREILGVDTYFSVNHRTERVELVVRGKGSRLDETERAVEWMKTFLFHSDLREENLPRLRDVVDLALKSARNRTRGSEESWVNTPVYAFWRQANPLLLHGDCFLTQVHALHRLRWRLREAPADTDRFEGFLAAVSANSEDREALAEGLRALSEGKFEDGGFPDLAAVDGSDRDLIQAAAEDLLASLAEIPDGSLSADVGYLCRQIAMDLAAEPAATLAQIRGLLDTVFHQDNLRGFLVSNPRDRNAITPRIRDLVQGMSDGITLRQRFDDRARIMDRVRERSGGESESAFVALVNESTRSGVHIHTADCADYTTQDPEELLRFLSARIYGGGGAHSMFMKTWGAGLAYSNGLRSNENYGRIIYYAERCPDLAQTLKFVVGELENAPYEPAHGEYAVAQAFSGNRSGARYEQRGEAMAADLADGVTAEVVARFRQNILDLRAGEGFYDKLHQRMKGMYGHVLPGYGPDAARSASQGNAIYYVIGPEKQIVSWEEYLGAVEPGANLTRLYPRDYWNPARVEN